MSSRAPLGKRHKLRACLEILQEGDELVVSKLDRLGRSQVEVINRLADLQEKGIQIRTLDGLINTRGLGRLAPLVIGLLTGLAEVERSLIQERTRESVEHRRKTGGNLGGRPKTSEKKERLVLRLRSEGDSYRSIRDQTGISGHAFLPGINFRNVWPDSGSDSDRDNSILSKVPLWSCKTICLLDSHKLSRGL